MFIRLESKSRRHDVTPEWLERLSAALTEQLEEFCDVVGRCAWATTTDPTVTASAVLTIFDQPDEPGAAGYHYLTPDGLPSAKVFTFGTVASGGEDLPAIEVTASHEILEMVDDLDADEFRMADDGTLYADEDCDAVEDVSYAASNGIMLSDYVLPSWYVTGSRGPWDRQRVLRAPRSKTEGGYLILVKDGRSTTDPPMAHKRRQKDHAHSRTNRKLEKMAKMLGGSHRPTDPSPGGSEQVKP